MLSGLSEAPIKLFVRLVREVFPIPDWTGSRTTEDINDHWDDFKVVGF
jgi:hypothetical protein